MPDPEHLARLNQGREVWNEWMRVERVSRGFDAPTTEIDLREAVLRRRNLVGYDLTNVNLTEADLCGANLKGAHLENTKFTNAKMSRSGVATRLDGAYIEDADFTRADLQDAFFPNTLIQRTQFAGTNLRLAHLKNARIYGCNFHDANLGGADLRGCVISLAQFGVTSLKEVRLNGKTVLDRVRITPNDNLVEEMATLSIPRRDRYLNWSWLRAIGRFPLFGVSWGALIASLVAVNTIGLLNETQLLGRDLVQYPIPIPHRMTLIIVSSLLLVIGSTFYRIFCPQRVQHFSETEWIEEHGKLRLLYLVESLRRRGQFLTTVATLVGGVLAFLLVVERLAIAFRYIAAYSPTP